MKCLRQNRAGQLNWHFPKKQIPNKILIHSSAHAFWCLGLITKQVLMFWLSSDDEILMYLLGDWVYIPQLLNFCFDHFRAPSSLGAGCLVVLFLTANITALVTSVSSI